MVEMVVENMEVFGRRRRREWGGFSGDITDLVGRLLVNDDGTRIYYLEKHKSREDDNGNRLLSELLPIPSIVEACEQHTGSSAS